MEITREQFKYITGIKEHTNEMATVDEMIHDGASYIDVAKQVVIAQSEVIKLADKMLNDKIL